jgi:hypothetical protein
MGLPEILGNQYAGGCDAENEYVPPECSTECDCTTITETPSFTITATGAFADYSGTYTLTNDSECTWLGVNGEGVEAIISWNETSEAYDLLVSGPAGNVSYESSGPSCPPELFFRTFGTGDMPGSITVVWS